MTDEEKANEDTNASIEKLNERGWRPGDGVKAVWVAMKDNPGHAVGGAVLGQILIPIPVVGAAAGATVLSWWAKKNDPAQNRK